MKHTLPSAGRQLLESSPLCHNNNLAFQRTNLIIQAFSRIRLTPSAITAFWRNVDAFPYFLSGAGVLLSDTESLSDRLWVVGLELLRIPNARSAGED
jgi:hypothetical protein